MDRDDLRAHLEFYGDLGVKGIRRDDVWGQRVAMPATAQTVWRTLQSKSKKK